jgi:hypothetical protein
MVFPGKRLFGSPCLISVCNGKKKIGKTLLVCKYVFILPEKKQSIAFHQEMLAGPEQRAAMKTHWKKVLDQLSKELAATS